MSRTSVRVNPMLPAPINVIRVMTAPFVYLVRKNHTIFRPVEPVYLLRGIRPRVFP